MGVYVDVDIDMTFSVVSCGHPHLQAVGRPSTAKQASRILIVRNEYSSASCLRLFHSNFISWLQRRRRRCHGATSVGERTRSCGRGPICLSREYGGRQHQGSHRKIRTCQACDAQIWCACQDAWSIGSIETRPSEDRCRPLPLPELDCLEL